MAPDHVLEPVFTGSSPAFRYMYSWFFPLCRVRPPQHSPSLCRLAADAAVAGDLGTTVDDGAPKFIELIAASQSLHLQPARRVHAIAAKTR
jgi:hypothetical protein